MNGPPGNRTGTYRIDNDDKGAPVVNGSDEDLVNYGLGAVRDARFDIAALKTEQPGSWRALSPSSFSFFPLPLPFTQGEIDRSITGSFFLVESKKGVHSELSLRIIHIYFKSSV